MLSETRACADVFLTASDVTLATCNRTQSSASVPAAGHPPLLALAGAANVPLWQSASFGHKIGGTKTGGDRRLFVGPGIAVVTGAPLPTAVAHADESVKLVDLAAKGPCTGSTYDSLVCTQPSAHAALCGTPAQGNHYPWLHLPAGGTTGFNSSLNLVQGQVVGGQLPLAVVTVARVHSVNQSVSDVAIWVALEEKLLRQATGLGATRADTTYLYNPTAFFDILLHRNTTTPLSPWTLATTMAFYHTANGQMVVTHGANRLNFGTGFVANYYPVGPGDLTGNAPTRVDIRFDFPAGFSFTSRIYSDILNITFEGLPDYTKLLTFGDPRTTGTFEYVDVIDAAFPDKFAAFVPRCADEAAGQPFGVYYVGDGYIECTTVPTSDLYTIVSSLATPASTSTPAPTTTTTTAETVTSSSSSTASAPERVGCTPAAAPAATPQCALFGQQAENSSCTATSVLKYPFAPGPVSPQPFAPYAASGSYVMVSTSGNATVAPYVLQLGEQIFTSLFLRDNNVSQYHFEAFGGFPGVLLMAHNPCPGLWHSKPASTWDLAKQPTATCSVPATPARGQPVGTHIGRGLGQDASYPSSQWLFDTKVQGLATRACDGGRTRVLLSEATVGSLLQLASGSNQNKTVTFRPEQLVQSRSPPAPHVSCDPVPQINHTYHGAAAWRTKVLVDILPDGTQEFHTPVAMFPATFHPDVAGEYKLEFKVTHDSQANATYLNIPTPLEDSDMLQDMPGTGEEFFRNCLSSAANASKLPLLRNDNGVDKCYHAERFYNPVAVRKRQRMRMRIRKEEEVGGGERGRGKEERKENENEGACVIEGTRPEESISLKIMRQFLLSLCLPPSTPVLPSSSPSASPS